MEFFTSIWLEQPVFSDNVLPRRKTLVVAGGSVLHFISLLTGKQSDLPLPEMTIPSCVAFSDDGKLLAVGSSIGRVDLVEVPTLADHIIYAPSGAELDPSRLRDLHGAIWALLFADSHRQLIAGTFDGEVSAFDIKGNGSEPSLRKPVSKLDGIVRGLVMTGSAFRDRHRYHFQHC